MAAALADTREEREEKETIADMIVLIRDVKPGDIAPMSRHFPSFDTRGYLYTCRHFDDPTGNCGIYERRPAMCSDYPYDRACSFAGCTWGSASRPYDRLSERGAERLHLVVLPPDGVQARLRELDEELQTQADAVRAAARCAAGGASS